MKAKTIQIAWHNRVAGKNDPILSLDFHPRLRLLATGGADNEVKVCVRPPAAAAAAVRVPAPPTRAFHAHGCVGAQLWAIADPNSERPAEDEKAEVATFKCVLTSHTATVNVVRFSPNGARARGGGCDNGAARVAAVR